MIYGYLMLFAKAGISHVNIFQQSSTREDSCPAVKSAAALSLAEFLPWRADLNRRSYQTVHGHTERVSDSDSKGFIIIGI